jgi:hypothetical protein
MAHTFILVTVPDATVPKDILDLVKNTPGSQTIDFYTMNMDLLSIIAKNRILPRTTLLVMNNTKVVGRFVDTMPKAKAVRQFLEKD